ncbi:hypothetical protein [Mesorhizobium sp. M1396]|uniref:hypothetical protein n=1 Tax=Mesorhizobium sp. M1396 TaxID=2957095 RepID=UPI003335838B
MPLRNSQDRRSKKADPKAILSMIDLRVCSCANRLQNGRLQSKTIFGTGSANWKGALRLFAPRNVCPRPALTAEPDVGRFDWPRDRSKEDMKQNVPLSSIDGGTRGFADVAVVGRLANLIKNARLDCECRSRLDETLARFAALEVRRIAREHLAIARGQRERIKSILFFLQDLDEMGAAERDRSVYVDLALLFDDIASTAKEGAFSMRQLSLSAVPTGP